MSSTRRGRRIVLWRHGQTAWNLERRFQGSTDIALTETGLGQARRAARLLAALAPDAIVSSDLRRAADTAAELAALTGLPVSHDEGLRETYAGAWQGLTHKEILERFGEQYTAWKRGEPVRRGGGELETEVADRAAPVVLAAADKLAGRRGAGRGQPRRHDPHHHRPAARPGVHDLGVARRPVQLLLVGAGRGGPRLAAHRAQRRHTARAGARRRLLSGAPGAAEAARGDFPGEARGAAAGAWRLRGRCARGSPPGSSRGSSRAGAGPPGRFRFRPVHRL